MNINSSDICQELFEDIPSDDRSVTSIDDTGIDKYYIIPTQNTNNIIEESSDLSDEEVSEESDVEILNLGDNNTYLLPSPIKTCSNQ
jgi:hypothetical protein